MNSALRDQILQEWASHGPMEEERKSRQKPPEGVDAVRDVPYVDDGKWQHALDIFFPKGTRGTLQTVIDIHGGGWMFGTKELNEYYCMSLAREGVAVVDINYTLVPDIDLKGQIAEVVQALNWVAAHGREHHCNTRSVSVTGDSAGAALALLAAVANTNPIAGVPPLSACIDALFLDCPVSCLHAWYERGDEKTRESIAMVIGSAPEQFRWWDSVDPSGFLVGARLPELMLFTAEEDEKYGWQARMLDALLTSRRIPHQYIVYPKGTRYPLKHVFNVLNPDYPESVEVNRRSLQFFHNAMARFSSQRH